MEQETDAPVGELEPSDVEEEILGDGLDKKEIRASEFVQHTGCAG